MARLEAPVTNTSRVAPAARASSTAYWISGLSTTGNISFGLALVAGRKRVPRPATGNTAVRITDFGIVLIKLLQQRQLNTGLSLTVKIKQGTCHSYRLHDIPHHRHRNRAPPYDPTTPRPVPPT